MASADISKADLIAERQANLPLPDDPPNAEGLSSSMDARNVNVGSGMHPFSSLLPSLPRSLPPSFVFYHPVSHPHCS